MAGLEERFLAWPPTCWPASRPSSWPRLPGRHRAEGRPPGSIWTTWRRSGISVADAVDELLDELPRAGRITFRRLTRTLVERLEVIVRFLAVLELYKRGLVDLEQAATFAELHIDLAGRRATTAGADGSRRLRSRSTEEYEG